MSAKQIQQIHQYTQSNVGIYIPQKALKQVEKNSNIIWSLIVGLCEKLKNKNIENAYAQIVFQLSDPKKHEISSKWLKDYMYISDLAGKLKTSYTMMDYIKPQKDKIINLISKIIEVTKGIHALRNSLDQVIVKEDVMTKELTKNKALEEAAKISLIEITQRKKNEKPLYEGKVREIEKINQTVSTKRQQKFLIISKQSIIKEEITQLQKIRENIKYDNENKQIRIQQLKRQVAQNAPEVKKEKRAVQQEFYRTEKESHAEIQLSKLRQSKIISAVEERRKYKNLIFDQIRKLAEVFNFLEQAKSKYSKFKEDNDFLKRRKNAQIMIQTEFKEKIQQVEISTKNNSSINESIIRQRQKLENRYRQVVSQITVLKERIKEAKEKNVMVAKMIQEFAEKIEEQKKFLDMRIDQINSNLKVWEENVIVNIDEVNAPLIEMKSEFNSYNITE